MKGKFLLDVHTHTVASGHAYSTVNENVEFAIENGLELLGISEHAPKMPGSTHPFYFLNLKVIPNPFRGIELLKGVELNILDEKGRVDLKNNLLKRLDYGIASLHPPCIEPMDADGNTAAIVNAMDSPYINIIGHPCDPRYPIDIHRVVAEARDKNVLLEINNASLNPTNGRAGGEAELLALIKECKKQAMPIILGSDAHFCTLVGKFDNALRLVEEANFPEELIINTNVQRFKDFIALKIR